MVWCGGGTTSFDYTCELQNSGIPIGRNPKETFGTLVEKRWKLYASINGGIIMVSGSLRGYRNYRIVGIRLIWMVFILLY